jgi:hypothetical protein
MTPEIAVIDFKWHLSSFSMANGGNNQRRVGDKTFAFVNKGVNLPCLLLTLYKSQRQI